jgi:hypothetical protein
LRQYAVTPGYLISSIARSDLLNHDRRILRIGGVNPDGAHWQIPEAAAVAAIEAGRWSFYFRTARGDQPVIVAVSKYGNKYLKGSADALQPDSLLALPEPS